MARSRRQYLHALVVSGGSVLAGCSQSGDGGTGTTTATTTNDESGTTPAGTTTEAETTTDDGTETTTESCRTTYSISFSFEYEERDGTDALFITHSSGDNIPVDRLHVRGRGFAEGGDAEQTSAGQWQGQASDDVVRAGHSVHVGIGGGDHAVAVVSRYEGKNASILAEYQGPESESGPDVTTAESLPPACEDDDTRDTPTPLFNIEYEERSDQQGIATVTHDGGETVSADSLYVRGRGFADVSGADQTAAGQWQGTSDGGEVATGDEAAVGIESDGVLRIVYEGDGYGATLSSYEAPDR